jgi:hypothetical protein
MFHASNTLSQVWENETQHSQVVFPLWKFEYYGFIKFWDKSEITNDVQIKPFLDHLKGIEV